MGTERKQFHIRLDADVYRALQAWAVQTRRSTTGAAEYLIERGMEVEPTFPTGRPSERTNT